MAEDYALGSQVTARTTTGETVTGEVFAFDAAAQCVVLREPGVNPQTHNVRVVKLNHVAEVLSRTPPPAGWVPEPLPQVDMDKCHQREEFAIKRAEMEKAHIGIGVSAEAQDIFDALVKTLPCRWDATTIVVLDEIRIGEPYTQCSGGAASANQRVQRVLELERQKLNLK
mmetsp:Transcript_12372/g.40719  ORF Transcript_12372/g.40719 Transcript_12372/m.40719 type:complete len:170 (+) Transcript_12372:74-583(+)